MGIKTKLVAFLFLISHVCFAANYGVQKNPLSFRPANRPGVLANVTVKGQSILMLVDTGASGPSIDYDVVQKLGIPESRTGSGSTPYGDIQPIYLTPVPIQINNVSITEPQEFITVKNEKGGLADDGIFGLISPPSLAVGQLVVLDLAEPAMYIVKPTPKDVSAWLRTQFKKYEFDQMPKVDAQPYHEIVDAKIDSIGAVKMTVDSGATTTSLYSDNATDSTKPVTIHLKNHICITRSARILPFSSPGHQNHLLGMDCLRGKILAFPPAETSSVWIGWDKP